MIALVSAAAALLLKRWGLWNRPTGNAACLLLLVILAALSWRQSRMYANLEVLYDTTIDRNPGCWMAHYNLGVVLADQGRFSEAATQFRRAVKTRPEDGKSHNNLGAALIREGRLDEATAEFRQALKILATDVDAHSNLAMVLQSQGKIDEAIVHYQRVVELKPDFAAARYNLGLAWPAGAGWRKRSSITKRSCRCNLTMPRSFASWATPWPGAAGTKMPSYGIGKPWRASQVMSRPFAGWHGCGRLVPRRWCATPPRQSSSPSGRTNSAGASGRKSSTPWPPPTPKRARSQKLERRLAGLSSSPGNRTITPWLRP